MAASGKHLNKSGIFKNIQQRSVTGKPSKPMDVSFVAIYNQAMPFDKDYIKKFFTGSKDRISTLLTDPNPDAHTKAYDDEQDAENHGLTVMQEAFNNRNEGLVNAALLFKPECLTAEEEKQIAKDDLRENAYWIFIMKGKAEEINAIIANARQRTEAAKTHGYYGAHGFGERILSAQDNSGRNLYTRGDHLHEYKIDNEETWGCNP